MAEPFIKSDCEPIDKIGNLTTCFLYNLDSGPVSASDLYKISYDNIKHQLEKDCRWIFEVCREEANKGRFEINFPYVRTFDDNDELREFIRYGENKNATVTTSVNLRATFTTASLGMRSLNKHHVAYLKGMGYEVRTADFDIFDSSSISRPRIESISWDIK